jgi:hypothetical protein
MYTTTLGTAGTLAAERDNSADSTIQPWRQLHWLDTGIIKIIVFGIMIHVGFEQSKQWGDIYSKNSLPARFLPQFVDTTYEIKMTRFEQYIIKLLHY